MAKLNRQFEQAIRTIVQSNCGDCHSGESAEAGIDLGSLSSFANVQAEPQKFETVLKMIRAGAMPPADYGSLGEEDKEQFVLWLNNALDHAAETSPRAAQKPTLRRLNRAEYDNTIRDLLGINFSPAKDFPSDEVGAGFDNIGDVLSVSPLHMEKYLDAAEQIAQAAINADAFTPFAVTVGADEFTGVSGGSLDRRGNYHMSRNGEVSANVNLPVAAEYMIRVEASADPAGDEPAKMRLTAAGETQATLDVESRRTREFELRCSLPAGESRIEAAFINDYYNPEAEGDKDRNLRVRSIHVERVGEPEVESLPEFHQQLISLQQTLGEQTDSATQGAAKQEEAEQAEVEQLARKLLRPFAAKAFRRPVSENEVNKYAGLASAAVKQGATFERGMQFSVMAILVSPHFLFHVEGEANATPGEELKGEELQNLEQYALASRLSYFLWSTMPDDELFALAAAGKLSDPETLKQQTRRMLADPRSEAFVDNFAGQWLNLRRLDEIAPNDDSIPGLDGELKSAMRNETEHFFTWVMRENRPILDLLQAKTTFVNQRLADHYGLPDVAGPEFQQIDLSATSRAGLLSQASILTITSNPTRTSPVKRGKWVLENILGDAPPDPPDDVPPLEEVAEANPELPLRDQLRVHRESATCNSCHQLMDEIGFGFEGFGPLGENRTQDDVGRDVDPTGQLPSGESFHGAAELVAILANKRSEQFVRCFTENLMTYALGRGVTRRDRATIDFVLANAAADNYRFERLVIEIVTSKPFMAAALTEGTQR